MIYEEPYKTPEPTLTTHVNDLEVLCKLMIDFENLKEKGFDLLSDVKFKGSEKYFDCLHGIIFFHLVREFWTYTKTLVFQVTSFVLGKKIVVTEKLITKLIGHDRSRVRYHRMMEKGMILLIFQKYFSLPEFTPII